MGKLEGEIDNCVYECVWYTHPYIFIYKCTHKHKCIVYTCVHVHTFYVCICTYTHIYSFCMHIHMVCVCIFIHVHLFTFENGAIFTTSYYNLLLPALSIIPKMFVFDRWKIFSFVSIYVHLIFNGGWTFWTLKKLSIICMSFVMPPQNISNLKMVSDYLNPLAL